MFEDKTILKSVLIISPNFPPINAPDMQRIRQSLSFYKKFGWNPVIACVDKNYVEGYTDDSLLQTIPSDIEIIYVKAFNYKLTRLFGLGDLGLRALPYYYFILKKLLMKRKFDLMFFSTTMFNVMIVAKYLKRKFNIPIIMDIQDPWLDYSKLEKPKELRPKKIWFAHTLSKFLEPIVMKNTDGVIAVTRHYIDVLKERYSNITDKNSEVITFGFNKEDFEYADNYVIKMESWNNNKNFIRGVYTGVVNSDMFPVIDVLFKALKKGLTEEFDKYKKLKLFFIGTNYAVGKYARQMVTPLAKKYGIEEHVVEITSRIPYLEALKVQKEAHFLMLIGSTNTAYSASKLYPYLYSGKPIIAVFNEESNVVETMNEISSDQVITFSNQNLEDKISKIKFKLDSIIYADQSVTINFEKLKTFSAEELTFSQTEFFNKILDQWQKS